MVFSNLVAGFQEFVNLSKATLGYKVVATTHVVLGNSQHQWGSMNLKVGWT